MTTEVQGTWTLCPGLRLQGCRELRQGARSHTATESPRPMSKNERNVLSCYLELQAQLKRVLAGMANGDRCEAMSAFHKADVELGALKVRLDAALSKEREA